MTTILIKKKDTAGAPAPGDLTNAAGGTEIAVNTATKRIYTKDSGGNVVEVGTNPSAFTTNLLFSPDNTYDIGASGASRPRSMYLGTNLTVGGLTSGLVTFAGTGGLLSNSSNFSWNGTGLGVGTSGASYLLDVRSGATALAAVFTSTNTTAYTPTAQNQTKSRILLQGSSATSATVGISYSTGGSNENYFGTVQQSDGTGVFVWQGYSGTAYAERARLDQLSRLAVGPSTTLAGRINAIADSYSCFTAQGSSAGAGTTVVALKVTDLGASNFANAQYDALSHALQVSSVTIASVASAGLSITGTTTSSGRFIVSGSSNAGTTDISYGSYAGGNWINTPSGYTGYLAVAGTSVATWNAANVDVPVGSLTVTGAGSRGVRLRGVGAGEVAIAGDGTTYVLSHNFYNTTSYATQLGGLFTYVAGGAMQYLSIGTGYNTAGIYVTSGNLVGINTDQPGNKLQVNSAAGLPADSTIAEAAILVKDTASNRRIGIGTYSSGTWIQASYPGVSGASYPLLLNPNGGSVGVGTSTPAGAFTIGGSGALQQYFISSTATSVDNAIVSLCNNAAAYSALVFDALSYKFSNSGTAALAIASTGFVTIGASTVSPYRLWVNDTANRTQSDAQISITGNGYQGFHWLDGTAYYIGQNSQGRDVRIYSGNDPTVGVRLTPNNNAWQTYSDERMKDIIEPIENALAKVLTLRTVIGKYKQDVPEKRRVMMIAQDVKAVLPEATTEDEDGMLGMAYDHIVPLLTAAIKELANEFSAYKASHP